MKRYKIPKGTKILRYIKGGLGENIVSTKDAYFTEEDIYVNLSLTISFYIPKEGAPWNAIAVRKSMVYEL